MLRRSSTARGRRVVLGCLGLLLLPVGLAHMAVNAVPVTHAGVTEHPVLMPTALEAGDNAKINLAQEDGKDYYQFISLRATLRHGGEPVQGATVVFQVGGHRVCEAVTSQNGKADCNESEKLDVALFEPPSVAPKSYTAIFVGRGPYPATSVTGDLRWIGVHDG